MRRTAAAMRRLIAAVFAAVVLAFFAIFAGGANQANASGDAQPASTEKATEPEPVFYSGSGDGVIDVVPPSEAWVLCVTGNEEGRHFAVKGYDAKGKSTELFVNTTDPYEGITLDSSLSTTSLEISAKGNWTVGLFPFPT